MNNQAISHPGEKLQGFIDGTLPEVESRFIADHLNGCARCRSEVRELKRIDRSLRQIPLEHASERLAGAVLERLHIAMPHDTVLRVFARIGAAFAFLLVGSTLIAVFAVTGVIDLGGLTTGGEDSGRWITAPWTILTQAARSLGAFVAKYAFFLGHQGASAILGFTVAVIILLAAVDLLLGRRSMHR